MAQKIVYVLIVVLCAGTVHEATGEQFKIQLSSARPACILCMHVGQSHLRVVCVKHLFFVIPITPF